MAADIIDLKEELPGQLQLTENAECDNWPEMGMEIHDVKWYGAEPDVGIMSDYADDYSVTAWIGNRRWVNDLPGFAEALHDTIGRDCTEDTLELLQMLGNRCDNAVADMEPPERYYPEYD